MVNPGISRYLGFLRCCNLSAEEENLFIYAASLYGLNKCIKRLKTTPLLRDLSIMLMSDETITSKDVTK